jgi:polyphosphate kinase
LSENVSVISVVGRFLEHARIFYFHNGGDEEYFIGSADLMKRNLESRVEVVTPVEDKQLQARLREIIDVQIHNRRVWDMQPDGSYQRRVTGEKDEQRDVHQILISMAKERLAALPVKKKQKVKTLEKKKKSSRKRN